MRHFAWKTEIERVILCKVGFLHLWTLLGRCVGCWVVEIQHRATVWAIVLVPNGEREETSHPWLDAETSTAPGEVLRHC